VRRRFIGVSDTRRLCQYNESGTNRLAIIVIIIMRHDQCSRKSKPNQTRDRTPRYLYVFEQDVARTSAKRILTSKWRLGRSDTASPPSIHVEVRTHIMSLSTICPQHSSSKTKGDQDKKSSQARRRVRHNNGSRILIRKNLTQSLLRHIFQPLMRGTHIKHIRTKPPIGLLLVDRVPLALRSEVRIAKIVSLARRDEIEI
jgi:hypothetical protein